MIADIPVHMPSFIAMPAQTSTAVVLLGVGLGLLHCFAGYILFRIALGIDGLLGGFWLGQVLVASVLGRSTPTDLWVGGLVVGVLGMLAAWLIFRAAFALLAGFAVAYLLASAIAHPPSLGAWVIGAIVGLIFALLCYDNVRKLVVFVTAIGGALGTVGLVAAHWGGLAGHPYGWFADSLWGSLAALLVAAGLAVVGVFVQLQSPFFIDNRYSPDAHLPSKRRSAARPPARRTFSRRP